MDEPDQPSNLPAQILNAISSVPKALVPATIKALDRMIGAAIDIPIAWLNQHKAKIDAQTQAYVLVESAIAKAAAAKAEADSEVVTRAIDTLTRKAYRAQKNRESISVAMLENLASQQESDTSLQQDADPITEVEEDWLNVFERYAEDASSERMQKLWGRVLAGEIRQPGKFSMRTLRFLSEFSQADALNFEIFCKNAFGSTAPLKLVRQGSKDISPLLLLEASGLINSAGGMGLEQTLTFNEAGNIFIREGDFLINFRGAPKTTFSYECIVLTPLGQELICLLPARDALSAARTVAFAMRTPQLDEGLLLTLNSAHELRTTEMLWSKSSTAN